MSKSITRIALKLVSHFLLLSCARLMYKSEWNQWHCSDWSACPIKLMASPLFPSSDKGCPFNQIFPAVFSIIYFLSSLLSLSLLQWHISPGLPQRHAPLQFPGRGWTLLQTAWTHQPFHTQGKCWALLPAEGPGVSSAPCAGLSVALSLRITSSEIVMWEGVWNSLFPWSLYLSAVFSHLW